MMNDTVKKIIDAVRKNGDPSVSFFTKKYDGVALKPKNFRVNDREIKEAYKQVNRDLLNALKQAKKNVELFQKKISPGTSAVKKRGITIRHIFTPLESVGIYVPGGSYSYPSTIIMTAVPAQVAGVKRIVMVSPPNNLTPAVLAAAGLCGVTEIYRVGGVQAIASLAYGTKTIPRVDKIVGPGNIYVSEAKRQVFGDVGIDMIAGPSEVLIIADGTANPEFVLSDLLAQCEHDKMAKAILVSLSGKLSKYCSNRTSHLGGQVEIMNIENAGQAADIANKIAPEHLQIITKDAGNVLKKIRNAGAVFMGNYTPVAVGDYFSGPSHVLPTGSTARHSSGLSVYSFLKSMAVIQYDISALKKNAPTIVKIAEAEGLLKHAESIKVRME